MRTSQRAHARRWRITARVLAGALALVVSGIAQLAPNVATEPASAAKPRPELQPFGTKVTGSPSVDDPPTLRAGNYRTTVPVVQGEDLGEPEDSPRSRHFLVAKPSGHNVRVSITAQQARQTVSGVGIRLATLEDETCASDEVDTYDADTYGSSPPLLTAGAIVGDGDSTLPDGCLQGRALLLQVVYGEKSPTTKRQQLQIGVITEPPARNGATLPSRAQELDNDPDPSWRPGPNRGRVTGGTSFDTATRLRPGVSHDAVRTGKARVYRFRLNFGQRADITTRFEPLDTPAGGSFPEDGIPMQVQVYAPGWLPINSASTSAEFSTPTMTEVRLPEVRFRNREDAYEEVYAASVAGEYYVVVSAEPTDTDYQIPLRTSLRIRGKTSGTPNYAGVASSDQAGTSEQSNSATVADQLPVALRAVLGAAATLALLALAVLCVRRPLRRR